MPKISGYAQDTSPSLTDYMVGVEASGPTTKRYVLSDVVTLFLNNIPAAEGSLTFVSSGLVWSGDAYASTRAASMTAGRVRVVTSFLSISAVTARTFTASKDTYVDVLDNGDGTGTLVYTEVANNAASPALAASSTRIAIIVTGATTIAAAGSINQGEETKVLPIASSIAYTVTDSLGNLICPRDQNHQVIGYRQATSDQAAITTEVDLTGLAAPVIVPTGRKIKINAHARFSDTSADSFPVVNIKESTTVLQQSSQVSRSSSSPVTNNPFALTSPSAGLHTYKLSGIGGVTSTLRASATSPASILIELM